jgi:hypothetical protein
MRRRKYDRIVREVERLRDIYYAGLPEQLGVVVRGAARLTGDASLVALAAALESRDYLDFKFPELTIDENAPCVPQNDLMPYPIAG